MDNFEKKGYGLFHKPSKTLVGVTTDSNTGGDCCCSERHTLDYGTEPLWIVDDIVTAAYAREVSTEWYNAGYETPSNPYEAKDLEVVEITISAKKTNAPDVPSEVEYINRRYNTPGIKSYDPGWTKYHLEHYPNERINYSIYDLKDLFQMEEELKKKQDGE